MGLLVLQYVDDILLCSETEEACSQASEGFLNLLAGCGYKASREKAQLCQQSVKYLGLIISKGMRHIGPERIKPILNHPLPMALRHLRGFGGITGYCCIWIPGYGELAWPLYKLITETQQDQTDKLVWSPDTQKAFKALQTALLKAPALSLPTGSEFVCQSLLLEEPITKFKVGGRFRLFNRHYKNSGRLCITQALSQTSHGLSQEPRS